MIIIGGPKMRGRNVGDLGGGAKERGKAKWKEGGWVGGWVGSSCGSSDATTAASLSLLRLLSSSLSLLTPSSSSGSSRCHDESETKCRLISCTFETSFVFLRLQLHFSCAMYMPCCSLWFFVAHDQGVAFFLSPVVCFVFFFSLVFWAKF